jgi:hypothetical protein
MIVNGFRDEDFKKLSKEDAQNYVRFLEVESAAREQKTEVMTLHVIEECKRQGFWIEDFKRLLEKLNEALAVREFQVRRERF